MVKKILSKSYLLLLLLFLYAPIILIVALSFTSKGYNFSFAGDFSFNAYTAIFTGIKSATLWKAIKNTLLIALVSSAIATVLGTFSAIGMFHLSPKIKKVVSNTNQLPLINSEIVMALSFMIFFATLHFPEGYSQLIIAHVTFCTPYVVLSVTPKLYQMDGNVYEAALDLGATPVKALFKVELPILVPGILSGFVMAFTISLDDFIITQFNKGSRIQTLSTYLYADAQKKGLEPFWFAVFTIVIILVVTVILVANVAKIKKKKGEQK